MSDANDIRPDDARAWDDVLITGTSGAGVRYESLSATVATVASPTQNDDRLHLKVWPDDGKTEGGKVWFRADRIERLVLVRREEE